MQHLPGVCNSKMKHTALEATTQQILVAMATPQYESEQCCQSPSSSFRKASLQLLAWLCLICDCVQDFLHLQW